MAPQVAAQQGYKGKPGPAPKRQAMPARRRSRCSATTAGHFDGEPKGNRRAKD